MSPASAHSVSNKNVISPQTSIRGTQFSVPLSQSSTSTKAIDVSPWLDQTPITIVPKYPMEMTIELFRKMGLRYVLITRNGKLLGKIFRLLFAHVLLFALK
jgi:hypothetical protein